MRTALLMLLSVLEESYPAELTRYLHTTISAVQRILDALEVEGLVSSRRRGVRVVTLNPLYPPARELRAFLLKLSDGYPEYRELQESRRIRPRRRDKPL